MLWGYARASSGEEDAHAQVTELQQAHVSPGAVVIEAASGSDRAPGLDHVLAELDPDDVLVVTDLSRLGRTVGAVVRVGDELARRQAHLRVLRPAIDTRRDASLLAAFTALVGIGDQLSSAPGEAGATDPSPSTRSRGVGRPRRLTDPQVAEVRRMYSAGETVARIAEQFAVPRTTVYGYLRR